MNPRPETFREMMEAASRIDLQQYNRQMEKRNTGYHGGYHQANTKKPRGPQYDKDGDVRMQLNRHATSADGKDTFRDSVDKGKTRKMTSALKK